MIGAEPGEIFVHRNVANMVVGTDTNAMAVINYAVNHLKVKHVVVCGHYFCGGVKAAMGAQDLGVLNPWLRNIRDVYRTHQKDLDAIADENDRYNKLVELNVQEQCINLTKTVDVQRAYNERGLEIHGWVFDVQSGKLIDLELDLDHLMKDIQGIYDLGT